MTNPWSFPVIYYSQYCWGFTNDLWSSELAAPACHPLSRSSQRKHIKSLVKMWIFFLNCLFWVISPRGSHSLVAPEVLVPLPALFTGILELCFLSKEGSNALPRNPCPKIKSLHISRLQAEPPQPRLFSGKKRAKGHSQELQALHVKCELDSRIYLKMPQQPKEFHVKAALSHGKCRVSF